MDGQGLCLAQQPARVHVDEGVFLERLLAVRCKPSPNMVPLIHMTCSLWRLWGDSCTVQKEESGG